MSRLIGIPRSIVTRLEQAEINLALNTLRDSVDAGWSYLAMAQGIADEFTDTTGIGSLGGATYDASGKYIHNPATYSADLTATGQTIFGSQHASYPATNAFDDSASTIFSTAIGAALADAWYGQDFGSGKTIRRIVATYNAAGGSPASVGFTACVLEYSDDAAAWTSAGAFTLGTGLTAQTFDFADAGSHRYWRVRATANANTGTANGIFPDLEMLEEIAAPNVSVASLDFSAGGTPIEARAVFLIEPMAGGFNPSNINFNFSRTAGASYATPTPIDYGAFTGSVRIITAQASLAAQGAGTTCRWLVSTFNNVPHRLHGAWMQWRF